MVLREERPLRVQNYVNTFVGAWHVSKALFMHFDFFLLYEGVWWGGAGIFIFALNVG